VGGYKSLLDVGKHAIVQTLKKTYGDLQEIEFKKRKVKREVKSIPRHAEEKSRHYKEKTEKWRISQAVQ